MDKSNVFKYIILVVLSAICFFVCIFLGSTGFQFDGEILYEVRIPRVICVALIGASLSVCGAVMQGLLRNPLADGTTLGVSSGSSLGAVIAIILSSLDPFFYQNFNGILTTLFSIFFGFVSLISIIFISYRVDSNLSTNTIILVGVIFSMFASALISLLISLFPQNAKTITFWTMGSTSSVNYYDCFLLAASFVVCSTFLLSKSIELNIFSIGEKNANNLGIDVRRLKILIMVFVSILVGVCVSICGTIGFVGLIVPHISRKIIGSNHKKLLPFTIIFGAAFLNIADLLSRTIVSPKELPIGVITSLIGAVIFIFVFCKGRRAVK